MQTSIDLTNWRIAPYSLQTFHSVDELIPVSRIERGEMTWELETATQKLDGIAFKDPKGKERQLYEVLEQTATRGFVVLKDGKLLNDWYGTGYDGKTPHILFSVSKSLTGALAGILVNKGLVDPDRLVAEYIPEATGSAYANCTVQNVLDMTVSTSFSEEYLDDSGDYNRYRRATLWNPPLPGKNENLHELLANLSPLSEPHGQVFRYRSPNSDMLGWILERASGKRFAKLFSEEIWKPMGAEADAYITVDAEETPRTAGGICMRTRDLARFGEMMRLGGKGIIPLRWVDDILGGGNREAWRRGEYHGLFPKGSYRNQWYLNGNKRGTFCAIGIHGQWLWIDPRSKVVIAKSSAQAEPADDEIDYLLIRAFESICRYLED